MKLTELPAFAAAYVTGVVDIHDGDPISNRLRELGFVDGEEIRVVGRGPIGADPLLIQIGFTRFALRRSEAARVQVEKAA
ncbi:MAG TPA: FeoA domain-containing protein [Asticcacaulis sp.]|nr:FeoA domain-containing protein [Asticcacaulis sp.]